MGSRYLHGVSLAHPFAGGTRPPDVVAAVARCFNARGRSIPAWPELARQDARVIVAARRGTVSEKGVEHGRRTRASEQA